jgi:voltage-gated potassium channel
MTNEPEPVHHELRQQRHELLQHLVELTEKPLIYLSFVWVALVALSYLHRVNRILEVLSYAIWAIFALDFVVKLLVAPDKVGFLKAHWLAVISLVLPAFRMFAIFRALRLLWTVNALGTTSLLQIILSMNRGLNAVRGVMGRRGVGPVAAFTGIVVLLGAAGMLQFENPVALRGAGVDPSIAATGLRSYGDAVWWTCMILTTIGSAYFPITAEGRVLCIVLALYGLAVFGYLTSALASYFIGKDREEGAQTGAVREDANGSDAREEIEALRSEVQRTLERIDRLATLLPDAKH